MLFFTLKTIFLSLLLIALIHYLYGFFKNTLTVPKVKDLVNKPVQRYNEMFAVINNENDYSSRQERNVKISQESMVPEKNVNSGQESMNPQGMNQQSMNQQSMNPQSMNPQGMNPQSMNPQSMQAELKNFLNELKKPSIQPTTATSIDALPNGFTNNFPAANESGFGSYTPF